MVVQFRFESFRPLHSIVMVVALFALSSAPAVAQVGLPIELIMDVSGEPGQPPVLDFPFGIAVDGNDHVYVSGHYSHNVFEVTPAGVVTEIINVTGAGLGAALSGPSEIAADAAGNVFVIGEASDNAFKIATDGTITELIDPLGDGSGSFLDFPSDIVVNSTGDVYVSSRANSNVFEISAAGVVSLVIDASGAGPGAPLTFPDALAVDANDNLYVVGHVSDNLIRRTPGGVITELIGPDGDGLGNLMGAADSIAIGPTGDVYVAAREVPGDYSIWVWRVADGSVEKLPISSPFMSHIGIGAGGEIFATSWLRLYEYAPDGTGGSVRLGGGGDGFGGNLYSGGWGLAQDSAGDLYTGGRFTSNVFRTVPSPEPGFAISLGIAFAALAMHSRRRANTGRTL